MAALVPAPTHQSGHTLDLIFDMGIDLSLDVIDRVPWSEHLLLKVDLSPPSPPCIGRELIYTCSWQLMGSDVPWKLARCAGRWLALWSLWSHLWNRPPCPLCSCSKLGWNGNLDNLSKFDDGLMMKLQEQIKRCLLRPYEMAVKVASLRNRLLRWATLCLAASASPDALLTLSRGFMKEARAW